MSGKEGAMACFTAQGQTACTPVITNGPLDIGGCAVNLDPGAPAELSYY